MTFDREQVVERAARAIADAANVPFVGKTQLRRTTAALPLIVRAVTDEIRTLHKPTTFCPSGNAGGCSTCEDCRDTLVTLSRAVPELLDEIEDAWRGLSAAIAQRDEQEMEAKKAWAEIERLRASATCVHGQTAEELCNIYPSIGEIEELRAERDALAAKVARVEAHASWWEKGNSWNRAAARQVRAALAGEL